LKQNPAKIKFYHGNRTDESGWGLWDNNRFSLPIADSPAGEGRVARASRPLWRERPAPAAGKDEQVKTQMTEFKWQKSLSPPYFCHLPFALCHLTCS
jgi:hypothetical protein